MAYTIMGLFLFSLFLASTSYAQCLETIKASQLIGIEISDIRGSFRGQISDVVVDPSNNRVSGVILSDTPGMGADHIAIPFDSLTRTGESLFVYNPSEEVYGESPYWTRGLSFYKKDQAMLEKGEWSSDLFGARVQTSDGEDVARIDDIMIDSTNGHVVYVVLTDVGGMTERMVAFPFSSLSKTDEDLFALNATRDQLLAAPDFSWSNARDLAYASQVYRYYGMQPYWE